MIFSGLRGIGKTVLLMEFDIRRDLHRCFTTSASAICPSHWPVPACRRCRASFAPATDAEQRYLIAIAVLGDGPYRTAEVAKAAGYSSIGGACAVRDELIGRELIWSPRRGLVDFTVPASRSTSAPTITTSPVRPGA